jgi:hypothetical protein
MKAYLFGRSLTVIFLAGALSSFMSIAATAAGSEGNTTASDDWQFKAEAYGWFPVIKGTLPTDDDIEIKFDDILENLDFTFMGGLMARRGKWSIVSDVVYLKLSADESGKTTIPVGPFNVPTRVDFDVKMENWIASLAGSYSIHQTDKPGRSTIPLVGSGDKAGRECHPRGRGRG